ncbi:MAG: transposase [Ancrocorticia sp.]|uniref:transposase n=1 Tax=Ancrocorticia sp. TaxID=2593684 RepID=UPI003F93D467
MATKGESVEIAAPRDRAGTFEPVVAKKRQHRLGSIEGVVLLPSTRANCSSA